MRRWCSIHTWTVLPDCDGALTGEDDRWGLYEEVVLYPHVDRLVPRLHLAHIRTAVLPLGVGQHQVRAL